jgi:hypothetical protein
VAIIEVFWGDEPDEQSERDFLAQLKEDLARRNVSATLLYRCGLQGTLASSIPQGGPVH